MVYGSLLKGLHNHPVIEEGELLGEHETEPEFTMVSLGGFPGVMHYGNTVIKGEVYEVDEHTFKNLDRLEGFNVQNPDSSFYIREQIETPFGLVWIYLLREGPHNYHEDVVEDGDWYKYYTSKQSQSY